MPPHRAGPGRVIGPAPHHVNMELGNHIAEGPYVELFHGPTQRRADEADSVARGEHLLHQDSEIGWIEVLQLPQPVAARDKHDPRIARVELKTRLAEVE